MEKESLKKELRGHLFPTAAAASSAQVASLFDSQIEAKDRAEGSHCSAMPVRVVRFNRAVLMVTWTGNRTRRLDWTHLVFTPWGLHSFEISYRCL